MRYKRGELLKDAFKAGVFDVLTELIETTPDVEHWQEFIKNIGKDYDVEVCTLQELMEEMYDDTDERNETVVISEIPQGDLTEQLVKMVIELDARCRSNNLIYEELAHYSWEQLRDKILETVNEIQ